MVTPAQMALHFQTFRIWPSAVLMLSIQNNDKILLPSTSENRTFGYRSFGFRTFGAFERSDFGVYSTKYTSIDQNPNVRTKHLDFGCSNDFSTEQKGIVRNPNVFGFRTLTVQ